jgi:hypothetical protein
MSLPVADGLLVIVKRDCDTCHLVQGVLDQIPDLVIASQDDPDFPRPGVVDDTALDLSWELQTEVTPTLYRIVDGVVVDSTAGWHRDRWERLAGVSGLGPGLPESRPGCGSKIFDPGTHERLLREHSTSSLRSRRVPLGELEDPFEAMFVRAWSDGLPLVPPTEDRVEWMLTGTHRGPDEVVCVMPPDLVECTVEKVAVNAVMAGCLPEFLPVVLAAVEAAATDEFNIHGLAATTYFSGPIVIVNGPIAHQLGMNSGINALGPGNRANATIGRALNLVVRNVGGSLPGGVDRATMGNPGKLTFCFAENEEGSPWESLAVERGFAVDQSTVTLFAGHGPTEIWDQLSRTPESLAASFAGQLERLSHPKLALMFDAVVVVSPEHARVFRDGGWDKTRLRHELMSRLERPGAGLMRGEAGVAEGMPESFRDKSVPKFRPDGLWFVHAGGGAGLFSGILPGWVNGDMGSKMTTVPVS